MPDRNCFVLFDLFNIMILLIDCIKSIIYNSPLLFSYSVQRTFLLDKELSYKNSRSNKTEHPKVLSL